MPVHAFSQYFDALLGENRHVPFVQFLHTARLINEYPGSPVFTRDQLLQEFTLPLDWKTKCSNHLPNIPMRGLECPVDETEPFHISEGGVPWFCICCPKMISNGMNEGQVGEENKEGEKSEFMEEDYA